MLIIKGLKLKCQKCQRKNIPLLSPVNTCQRCIIFAFGDYAEKQWREEIKKHA